ncbi:hypothetical protein D4R75_06145 [bacterium]|nr:MAG: hypothetical protein D4R75_06145 [bacterium]
MFTKKAFVGILISFLCMSILVGCTETATQPISDPQTNIAASSTAAMAAINNELSLVKVAGVSVDANTAMFSINWREFFDATTKTSTLIGRAFAVGPANNRSHGSVHIGNVYLNYNSNHLVLQKRTDRRGGVAYSTFEGRCDSAEYTNVDFVPGESYEFEATGSTTFSALKASITAPTALLAFQGITNGATISTTNDLTLTWKGGNSSGPILLTVIAMPSPGGTRICGPDSLHDPGGPPYRNRPHGPDGMEESEVDGVGFGSDPSIGDPPMPIDSSRAIIVSLTNNPGTYTVSASAVQALVSKTKATKIDCMVSQVSKVVQAHDTGSVKLVIGNDDQVHLFIQ